MSTHGLHDSSATDDGWRPRYRFFVYIEYCEYCEYSLRWRSGAAEGCGEHCHQSGTERMMVNATLQELEVPDDEAVRQSAAALGVLQAFLADNTTSGCVG